MLTTLENKSMATAAPDIETLQARVAQLRADGTRQEQQLHAAKGDLSDAEAGIADAMLGASKGMETRERMTGWLFAQSAAQNKILVSIEALAKTRAQLGRATDALAQAEAHQAAREAAAFESEIVAELQAFSTEMLVYLRRCQKLQALRERAREFNFHLLTPGLIEALNPNWGEILNADAAESRLALIAKCVELPVEPSEIVRTAARRRAIERKAELDRGARNEAERKRGAKFKLGYAFEMKYDEEEQKLVYRELFDY